MIDVLKDFYEAISIIDLIYLIITILSLITCYKKGFILSILISVFSSFDRTFNIIPDQTKESSILYQPLSEFAPSVFPYLNFDGESAQDRAEKAIGIT